MHRVCKGTFRRVASALSTTLTAWFWMNSKISIELQRGSTSLPRYNFDKRGYCRRVAFCGKLKAGEVEGLGCTSWRLHMVIGEQYFFETSPYLTLVPSCPILSHLVPSCPILSPYFSVPGCSSASSCALLQNVPWLKGVVPSTAYDFHHRDPNFARACEELAMGKLLGSFECLKTWIMFVFGSQIVR